MAQAGYPSEGETSELAGEVTTDDATAYKSTSDRESAEPDGVAGRDGIEENPGRRTKRRRKRRCNAEKRWKCEDEPSWRLYLDA